MHLFIIKDRLQVLTVSEELRLFAKQCQISARILHLALQRKEHQTGPLKMVTKVFFLATDRTTNPDRKDPSILHFL